MRITGKILTAFLLFQFQNISKYFPKSFQNVIQHRDTRLKPHKIRIPLCGVKSPEIFFFLLYPRPILVSRCTYSVTCHSNGRGEKIREDSADNLNGKFFFIELCTKYDERLQVVGYYLCVMLVFCNLIDVGPSETKFLSKTVVSCGSHLFESVNKRLSYALKKKKRFTFCTVQY